ncbi:MAG: hypothetical protein DME32_13135 [Verrucomicrobia bacterium]|nr:MAG: hypothetical protein DME32_13135 [Verrucomicrobiota bacterium]
MEDDVLIHARTIQNAAIARRMGQCNSDYSAFAAVPSRRAELNQELFAAQRDHRIDPRCPSCVSLVTGGRIFPRKRRKRGQRVRESSPEE